MTGHRMQTDISISVCHVAIQHPIVKTNWPGHALNKILKDIIDRFHVSIGDRVQSVKTRAVLWETNTN